MFDCSDAFGFGLLRGRVVFCRRGCNVAFGGGEVAVADNYEIL